MRRILYSIVLLAATAGSLAAKSADEGTGQRQPTTPFEYPSAPDSLSTLDERTSYVMLRFWNKADMKKLMADTAQFHKAFADFISFAPYARADSVRSAITALTGRYANDPKSLLLIASEAERTLFGPEAEFWSEDCYILFLRSVLTCKKIKQADKEKYLAQIRMLNSSQKGASIAIFDYTTRYGARHSLYDNKADYVILLFQPEECSDCAMTRLRLSADVATSRLVKNGTVKIVIINPAEPSAGWRADMEDYPYDWEIGSAPDVGTLVDVRMLPTAYLLDKDFRILARNLNLNQLLAFTASVNHDQMLQPQGEAASSAE